MGRFTDIGSEELEDTRIKTFKVIEKTLFEQTDYWEFKAKSKKELKEKLKDPFFNDGVYKKGTDISRVKTITKII